MDVVTKPTGELYETTDQIMCEVLMMAGFNAVSIKPTSDSISLVYAFSLEEVWPTIEAILSGKADELTFKYTDWWKAKITWQMNLRHHEQVRRRRYKEN